MRKQISKDNYFRIATVVLAILSMAGIIGLSIVGKGPTVEVV